MVGEGSCDSKAELSNEYRQQIQEAFDLFDMDKDRTIDFQEFRVNYSPYFCFMEITSVNLLILDCDEGFRI